jgi:hypothetical protein
VDHAHRQFDAHSGEHRERIALVAAHGLHWGLRKWLGARAASGATRRVPRTKRSSGLPRLSCL